MSRVCFVVPEADGSLGPAKGGGGAILKLKLLLPVDNDVGLGGRCWDDSFGSSCEMCRGRKLLTTGTMPRSDEGLGRVERMPSIGGGGGGGGSVKTPSSGSASQRVLPLQWLMASQSARVSLSEISERRPEVVTESERA